MAQVVVVGAGISGLATAFRIYQVMPGAEITVLEQAERLGGTIQTLRRDGFQIEAGPNGFLDNKPSTLDLCRELGLAGDLITASESSARNRYLFQGDRLQALPGSLTAFLKTDLLSWRGKWSLLMERFRGKRRAGGDESIDAFARRRAGTEVADVLADALVTGIHAGDAKLLSVQAAFPRLVALEQEHGSLLKGIARAGKKKRAEAKARGEPYQRGSKLWSLRGGLGQLIEALARRLPQSPRAAVRARELARNGARWTICTDDDNVNADAVVLACPAFQQAALLQKLDADLAERIGGIAYNRVAVVALGFRRADVCLPLDGFGYIAPQRLRRDVLGVQWCSSIFPGRAPEDAVLMRAMCGGWHRADVVGWDDQRLLEAMRVELQLAMGITAAPCFHEVVRWDRAIPQYHLGHCQRVAGIEARLATYPGLFLTGNAYHGVALNDCTERAAVVAGQLRGWLSRQPV